MKRVAVVLSVLMLFGITYAQDAFEDEIVPVKPAPKVVTLPAPPQIPPPVKKEVPVDTKTAPITAIAPSTKPAIQAPAAPIEIKPVIEPEKAVKTPVKTEIIPEKKEPAVSTKAPLARRTEDGILEETVCAVNGVKISINDKTLFSDDMGTRYYFVDARSKQLFDKSPYKYEKDILTCKVCGKQEKKRGRGTQMFQEGKYEGRSYSFCSTSDKEEFFIDPLKYVKETEKFVSSAAAKKKKNVLPARPKKETTAEPAKEKAK